MEIEKGTYLIDLTKSEDELLSQCDKDTRYCIRKGVSNHITPTIYENVFVIHLQDKDYKPSSMLVFKVEGEVATLLATNTDSAQKALQGNSQAYWEMIKLAKSKGVKILDLGGVEISGPTDSQVRINKFKEGYGGQLKIWTKDVSLMDWGKSKFKRFVKK